jgi:hypothetical protein
MTRDEVIAKLKEGLISLEFEKADGTIRPMIATLSEDMVPPSKPDGNGAGNDRKKSTTAQAVWDIDVAEWRSFRWDKLRHVDGVDTPNGIQ